MNYIWNRYKKLLMTYIICSFLFAAMPWMSGPYLVDVLGIFVVTTMWFLLSEVIVLPTWRSLTRRKQE